MIPKTHPKVMPKFKARICSVYRKIVIESLAIKSLNDLMTK